MGCRRIEAWLALLSLLLLAGCERSPVSTSPPKKLAAAAQLEAAAPPQSTVATKPPEEPKAYAEPKPSVAPESPAASEVAMAKNTPAPTTPAANVPVAEPAATEDDASKKTGKVDPVKVNGPIFEGWKTPNLAILITGEQLGYLEPCGCAGLENQKGGLGRRATLIKQLRAQGWPVVAIDLGGLVRRFGQQE
ncbi:MAG TPA: hypothetical protein VHY20_12355, partial [Pirellulales bacterium]|nr:hypothetical protein [Pirellulales bacterium]